MATRADFTDEEWKTVVAAPGLATMYIVVAQPSGPIGAVQEMMASGKAIAASMEQGTTNPLLQALFEDVKAQMEAMKEKKEQTPMLPASVEEDLKQAKTPEETRAKIGALLSGTAALVAAKTSPEDATGYGNWLLSIARNVAEAAKEGGFLGFGGTRVSDQEQAALTDLAAIFGVPPAADIQS